MEHLSLFELNKIVGEVLTKNLEPSYWIVAEIGEMRQNQKGHCYLELVEKEDQQIKAKSRATIWSYTYRNLSGWFEAITGQSLKPGMKILCNVTIQFHEVYGFSLSIKDIDAQYTLGEREKRKQDIIKKLQEDGIFDMNKELKLPVVPQRIAVISSETAAGFGDFIDQIQRNEFGYHFDIQLFNSIMQGDQAEASIINAMHQVFESVDDFDLIAIIRGGGATLDFDCFDSYDLGSHIAQFPLPVITGIGHERDETIADLVAHTKMKTPTAVAEFLISGVRNFDNQLDAHLNFLANILNQSIEEEKDQLIQLSHRIYRNSQRMINRQDLKLNSLLNSFRFNYENAQKIHSKKLQELSTILLKSSVNIIENQQQMLYHLDKEINALDPENVLKRGYSITYIEGINVNNIDKFQKDSIMITRTHKAELQSKLITTKKK